MGTPNEEAARRTDINWEKAAVFAAISIFLAPIIYRYVSDGIHFLRQRKCKIIDLTWDDIPCGKLHDCGKTPPALQIESGSYAGCLCFSQNSHKRHERKDTCWDSETLGVVFNRGWQIQKKGPNSSRRGSPTFPHNAVVRTDARTIMAFILYTNGSDRRHAKAWTSRVQLQTWRGHLICHLTGYEDSEKLTKHEVEKMLEGYPPWYRENFLTRENVLLDFPIHSHEDVPRGGWIIAVGLMERNPLSLYRCQDEPEPPPFRCNGVVFRAAIVRCRDHIQTNILPHFPDNENVKGAVKMLTYLIENRTGSGIVTYAELSQRRERDETRFRPMRGSHCEFIMRNFNAYRPLQPAEVEIYKNIISSAMMAVVWGAYEVIQYLKDHGVFFKFPQEIKSLDQEVYLIDCAMEFPY